MGGTMRLGAYPAPARAGHTCPRDLRRRGRVRAAPPPLRAQQPVPPGARGPRHGVLGQLARRAARRVHRAAAGDAPVLRRDAGAPRVQEPAEPSAPAVRRVRRGRPPARRGPPAAPADRDRADRERADGWRRCRADVTVAAVTRRTGRGSGRRAGPPARGARRLARGRTRPRRRTRAPRTAATCAATPSSSATRGEVDPAAIGEPTVQDYVRHLGALTDDDGRPLLAAASIAAGAGGGALVPRVLRDRGPAARPIPARRSTRRVCRRESRRRSTRRRSSSCSARSPATARCRSATARCSRRSTRPASASARRSGSSSAISISKTAWCACSARATRSASSRSAAARAGSWARTSATAASRCAAPASRRAADSDAVFLNARGGRISRQACWSIVRNAGARVGLDGPPLAARAAALVRDAHARSGRRPAGRPGAARPRQHLDHPGVHEGLAGAAAGRLRRRAPAGPGARSGLTGGRSPVERVRSGVPSGHVRCDRGGTARGAHGRARAGHQRARGDGRRPRDLRRRLRRLRPGHGRAGRGRRARRLAARHAERHRRRARQDRRRHLRRRASSAAEPIGDARLEAMPAARLCIACASARR